MATPPRKTPHLLTAEDALHEHLLYFMRMFAEAPAACIVTDPGCMVLDANTAAQEMLAGPLTALRNKPFRLLVALSDRSAFAAMATDMLLFPFNSSRPLCMKPLIGLDVDVLFKAALMRTEDGEPEFISWMFIETPSQNVPDLM